MSKFFSGAKAVIKIGDKIIGEVKNIEWRKASDPIPMDKPGYKTAAQKLAAEIGLYVAAEELGLTPKPRLIINGEEVPWPP